MDLALRCAQHANVGVHPVPPARDPYLFPRVAPQKQHLTTKSTKHTKKKNSTEMTGKKNRQVHYDALEVM